MNTKNLAMTAVMAALMAVAGMALRWVSPALVPFSILPLLVYIAGIVLGPRLGALSMVVYILLGLFGLPVYATAPFAGIGYIMKPTFGFLIGYIFAAYAAGLIYKPGSLVRAFVAALGGVVVIYAFGLIYFYGLFNWVLNKPMSITTVIAMGFTPYIVMDLIKAVVAAIVGNEVVRRRAQ
ncbi:MAG: biotin transporter BioY [Desulfitobacteriaceae bacterium]